eukprot:UC4_evm2s1540
MSLSCASSNKLCNPLLMQQVATRFGTPTYIYSKRSIESAADKYIQALSVRPGSLACFAVKANSNLSILNLLAKRGAGFDIVSQGELERVLAAGGSADAVIFSGVGKSCTEIKRALEVGIKCFNVESENELVRIQKIAQDTSICAPVSIRVNPNIDAKSHPYISTGLHENKFGVSTDIALKMYKLAAESPHLIPVGIDCHIGSQMLDIAPLLEAMDRILALAHKVNQETGVSLKHVDIGGGLGINYIRSSGQDPSTDISHLISKLIEKMQGKFSTTSLIVEPGRSVVGPAGVLLTRIEYVKKTPAKNFVVVDAAMNDLLRPSLYSAYHVIEKVKSALVAPSSEASSKKNGDETWDIVGPVCETGDFIGKERSFNSSPKEGELLQVLDCGAYGFTMSSNYNTRGRPAEVLVPDFGNGNDCDTGKACDMKLIRPRETAEDLFRTELSALET